MTTIRLVQKRKSLGKKILSPSIIFFARSFFAHKKKHHKIKCRKPPYTYSKDSKKWFIQNNEKKEENRKQENIAQRTRSRSLLGCMKRSMLYMSRIIQIGMIRFSFFHFSISRSIKMSIKKSHKNNKNKIYKPNNIKFRLMPNHAKNSRLNNKKIHEECDEKPLIHSYIGVK